MTATAKVENINIVCDRSTPALSKLFESISRITTLPVAAQRIMQLSADRSASATDLLSVVEGDPVLAARVLRRVNSAFYGLPNKVEDLRNAVNLLGFREIRNLALTVYLARTFDGESEYRHYSRQGLWQHCTSVAHVARLISTSCKLESPDEAYLAGLLHDLGLILLDQYLPKYLHQIVDLVSEGADTCQAERALLPFDHAQLGAYVATQWNFPAAVIAAARYHHQPLDAPSDYQTMASIIAVANYLCHRAGVTSLGTQNHFAPSDAIFSQLELDQSQLEQLWEQLQDALENSPAL